MRQWLLLLYSVCAAFIAFVIAALGGIIAVNYLGASDGPWTVGAAGTIWLLLTFVLLYQLWIRFDNLCSYTGFRLPLVNYFWGRLLIAAHLLWFFGIPLSFMIFDFRYSQVWDLALAIMLTITTGYIAFYGILLTTVWIGKGNSKNVG